MLPFVSRSQTPSMHVFTSGSATQFYTHTNIHIRWPESYGIWQIPQIFFLLIHLPFWSQCSRGLRRGSAAVRLLSLWVRVPPGALMSVSCKCCVLSSRGFCVGLITRPEESYRMFCVVVCDLETSWMWRSWSALGRSVTRKNPSTLHSPPIIKGAGT